jgi:phage shock protein PspC (stress-responsive transcriptional regulator)
MSDTPRRTKFYLDKQRKKWLGVCAGIADYTGIDVTIVRIGMVLGTILGSGALIIVYLAAGIIAPPSPASCATRRRRIRSSGRASGLPRGGRCATCAPSSARSIVAWRMSKPT